jgi:hypothetical protein
MFDGYFHSLAKAESTPIIFFSNMQENFMLPENKKKVTGGGEASKLQAPVAAKAAHGRFFVETTGIRISLR